MQKLNRVVDSMLKENTGRVLTDSGDAYGRSWQRNQNKDFRKEPDVTLEFSVYEREGAPNKLEVSATINLYAWLDNHMTFAKNVDARFQRFASKHPDEPWLVVLEMFAEQDADNPKQVRIENTYNFPDYCDLSQTLQYAVYEDKNGDEVWLISVHGGCDVRSGYTKPRAFYPKSDYVNMNVDSFYAGEYAWYADYGYSMSLEPSGHNPREFDFFDLPCYLQIPEEEGALPDLSEVSEECVIVVSRNGSAYYGDGYLVLAEFKPHPYQLDILTREFSQEVEFVAYPIEGGMPL